MFALAGLASADPLPSNSTLLAWGNSSNAWESGNLGSGNSAYKEGDVIPFRLEVKSNGTFQFTVCNDFSNGTRPRLPVPR